MENMYTVKISYLWAGGMDQVVECLCSKCKVQTPVMQKELSLRSVIILLSGILLTPWKAVYITLWDLCPQ
jgi:hypothetical protein